MISSKVVQRMPSSGIREIFDRAVALERQGRRLIRLDVGRPDFDPPRVVLDATKQAIDDGHTRYVANRGIPALLEAISRKLATENGLDYDPDCEIIVTTGASEAVAVAMFGILEPGTEVLVPEPLWPHYAQCARLAAATPVTVPLSMGDEFSISAALLERYVTQRTRMLVLNSPCNPTGRVYGRETLDEVLAFAQEHDLYVLADEIYEYFVYDEKVPCFASLPGARERTILVNGFSKGFGMTGYRLGYLAAPAPVVAELNKPHQYITVCATAFAQWGAVAAYTSPEAAAYRDEKIAGFRRRRDALLEEVSGAAGLRHAHPGGAFYFFPELPEGSESSTRVAVRLLEEAGVAAVPGSVFGKPYDGCLRISYGSCSLEDLREAIRRILDLLYR